jgi:hypothetical protein
LIHSQEVLVSKFSEAWVMLIMDKASLIKWIQWMGLSVGGLKLFTFTLLRMTLFLWNGMVWLSQTISLGLSEKTCVSLIVRKITWRTRSWQNCESKYMEACVVMQKY